VRLEPGGHDIRVTPGENVLAAALAAGIPLPHSCRAGRCASCKARLASGSVAYPQGVLPAGITRDEAARGDVLLCQAQPLSDLHVVTRVVNAARLAHGVLVEGVAPLATGGARVSLRLLGAAALPLRPGQFVDVETADGRERVPVVAASAQTLDVEMLELDPRGVLRVSGPFTTPR
jgi:CDP-4-dehydro-6-deoxyglucose reductase